MEFKEVTKEEYIEFINNYPVKLQQDCFGASDPPLFTHNDFSDGKKWPESAVGKFYKEDEFRGDKAEYYILSK